MENIDKDFAKKYTSSKGTINFTKPFAHLYDIANTIINWLEYTQLIFREDGKIFILEEKIPEVDENSEVEETAEDSFTNSEKKLLEKICPEINLDAAMGYCMDSKEFFIEMVQEFFNGDKTEEVKKSYDAEDWKNYRILVHALKSTSLVIGAENFSAQAKAQEFAAKDEDIDELKKNHEEFIINYEKLLKEIGQWLKETANAKNIDS